jgi:hypothetical protein
MAGQALFGGLIVDEMDRPVDEAVIGGAAFYVVDDDGFLIHIESEKIDRQVLTHFQELIEGKEDLISEGTMKMIGQEDIFTKAAIESSLKHIDSQFDQLIEQGLPEEARSWLGMVGFRIVINHHGEVLKVEQPSASEEPDD